MAYRHDVAVVFSFWSSKDRDFAFAKWQDWSKAKYDWRLEDLNLEPKDKTKSGGEAWCLVGSGRFVWEEDEETQLKDFFEALQEDAIRVSMAFMSSGESPGDTCDGEEGDGPGNPYFWWVRTDLHLEWRDEKVAEDYSI